MQRLEVEYQVQLADILKQPVQTLDKDLDQIQQCKRRLGARADQDEVECGVVSVCDQGRRIILRLERCVGRCC